MRPHSGLGRPREANLLRAAMVSSLRRPAGGKQKHLGKMTSVQSLRKGLCPITNASGPGMRLGRQSRDLGTRGRAGGPEEREMLKPHTVPCCGFCCKSFKPNANELNLAMFKRRKHRRQNILS